RIRAAGIHKAERAILIRRTGERCGRKLSLILHSRALDREPPFESVRPGNLRHVIAQGTDKVAGSARVLRCRDCSEPLNRYVRYLFRIQLRSWKQERIRESGLAADCVICTAASALDSGQYRVGILSLPRVAPVASVNSFKNVGEKLLVKVSAV